jgi:ribosomal protein S18 acetylase RimI-like enzyme
MTTSLAIRTAQGDEIEQARRLTNRSWLTTYAPLIGEAATREIIADRHSSERFSSQAEAAAAGDTKAMFLIAEEDGAIVGHCHVFEADGRYVDRLHVAPEAKGRGIGRALLRHVEALQLPGVRVWLTVLEGNDDAMAFYERVGFKQCGKTDACGGLAGIPAVIFEKTLAERSDQDQERPSP